MNGIVCPQCGGTRFSVIMREERWYLLDTEGEINWHYDISSVDDIGECIHVSCSSCESDMDPMAFETVVRMRIASLNRR